MDTTPKEVSLQAAAVVLPHFVDPAVLLENAMKNDMASPWLKYQLLFSYYSLVIKHGYPNRSTCFVRWSKKKVTPMVHSSGWET